MKKIAFCALCVLCGFFVVGTAACGRQKPASKPAARNLLLITIDTLRADHVGAYGWSRAHTPTLDGLAKNGALFERAYAAAPITLPSHATLLTGRYPPGHGARDNGLRLSPDVPTLATELHAKGFATAFREAVIRNDAPDVLSFDNFGVMVGITTPLGTFEGISDASSIQGDFIRVTGALDDLLGPERGWNSCCLPQRTTTRQERSR